MNPDSSPQIWRFHKESLRPQSKNPGLLKRMLERQQRIKNEPEVETNFEKYQLGKSDLPPVRK